MSGKISQSELGITIQGKVLDFISFAVNTTAINIEGAVNQIYAARDCTVLTFGAEAGRSGKSSVIRKRKRCRAAYKRGPFNVTPKEPSGGRIAVSSHCLSKISVTVAAAAVAEAGGFGNTTDVDGTAVDAEDDAAIDDED